MSWEVHIDTPLPTTFTAGRRGGIGVGPDGTVYAIIEGDIYKWNGSAWVVATVGDSADGGYGLTYNAASNNPLWYIYIRRIYGYVDGGGYVGGSATSYPPGSADGTGRALAIGDDDSDHDIYYLYGTSGETARVYGGTITDQNTITISDWELVLEIDLSLVAPGWNLNGMAVRGNTIYLMSASGTIPTLAYQAGNSDEYREIGGNVDGGGLALHDGDLYRLGADEKVYRFENWDPPVLKQSPRRLTGEDRYYALEITHPTASGFPVRVVADNQNHTIDGNEYTALAFRALPPNFQDGEMPQAILEIDNVGKVLTDPIADSQGGRGAKMKVMQVVRGDDESEIVWELPALPVGVTSITHERVQVSLAYRSGRLRPAIKWRHTHEVSPGLY